MTFLNNERAEILFDTEYFIKGEVVTLSGNPYYMRLGKNSHSVIYAVNTDGIIELVPIKKLKVLNMD